jgi:hypothetical protein
MVLVLSALCARADGVTGYQRNVVIEEGTGT